MGVLVPNDQEEPKQTESGEGAQETPAYNLDSSRFIEVVQMKAGKSFGEKALMKYN